jgi:hypothetical protein
MTNHPVRSLALALGLFAAAAIPVGSVGAGRPAVAAVPAPPPATAQPAPPAPTEQ